MLSRLSPMEVSLRRLPLRSPIMSTAQCFQRLQGWVTHLMDGTLLMGKFENDDQRCDCQHCMELQPVCTLWIVNMFIITFDFWNSFRKDRKYKYNSAIKYSRFPKMDGYAFSKWNSSINTVFVEIVFMASLPSPRHLFLLHFYPKSNYAYSQQNKIEQEFQRKGFLKSN